MVMETKIADPYKAEIIGKFQRAKKHVVGVISKLELGCDWQSVHKQINIAIQELRQATTLLVRRHIEVCIIEHKRQLNLPIVHEDIEEIVKTYKYLD